MAGVANWFSQVGATTRFGLLSIPQRGGSVLAAVVGVAGVVGVANGNSTGICEEETIRTVLPTMRAST